MSDTQFDIVICVGPNDAKIIESSIPYTKKNVIGYRNIYLVSYDPEINIPGTITIDEKMYPFSKRDFINKRGENERHGWYLQQLLKMYAGNIIPGILKSYLVIDSDTFFLKPTQFLTEDGKPCLTAGYEYHDPYFKHMRRLHPALCKHPELNGISGISHHMFFHTEHINELFDMVEEYHLKTKPFWELMIDMVDSSEYSHSGFSEYEIYFNYMHIFHREDVHIRHLKWENRSRFDEENANNHDFVSIHWYMRPK